MTGSDTIRDLEIQLLQGGLLGEQITDNSVWMVKTHYPLIFKSPKSPFKVGKVLCCARNPFDSIYSLF